MTAYFDPPFDPTTDFAHGQVALAAADRLKAWWAERGLEPAALRALLDNPISSVSFTGNLTRAIRIGRALRHGA